MLPGAILPTKKQKTITQKAVTITKTITNVKTFRFVHALHKCVLKLLSHQHVVFSISNK